MRHTSWCTLVPRRSARRLQLSFSLRAAVPSRWQPSPLFADGHATGCFSDPGLRTPCEHTCLVHLLGSTPARVLLLWLGPGTCPWRPSYLVPANSSTTLQKALPNSVAWGPGAFWALAKGGVQAIQGLPVCARAELPLGAAGTVIWTLGKNRHRPACLSEVVQLCSLSFQSALPVYGEGWVSSQWWDTLCCKPTRRVPA